MNRIRFALVAAGATVALLGTACGDGNPNPSPSGGGSSSGSGSVGSASATGKADTTVKQVTGQKFSPDSVNVKVGQTVEWVNADTIAHNVTFTGHDDLSNGNMNQGDTWYVTFTQAGSYPYQCTFHSGMTGTVTVS